MYRKAHPGGFGQESGGYNRLAMFFFVWLAVGLSSVVGWSGVNDHHVLFVLQDERDHGMVVLLVRLQVVSGLIVIRASMPMVVDAVGGVGSFPVAKQPLQQVPDDVLLCVVEVPT